MYRIAENFISNEIEQSTVPTISVDKTSNDRTFDLPEDEVLDMTSEKIDFSTFDMMSLKEFLSRPVKVQSLSWVPGTALNATVSLGSYLGLTPIKHKINQFARARFTQVVTVSYTANPFHSGSLLLSALPMGSSDQLEPARLPLTPVQADFVRLTQRPHVFMSVNKSETVSLRLPYFNNFNWISLNQTETALISNPYTIAINSVNNLQHCNGSTDPVTVNVFFSLEDLALELPTTYYASSSEDKKVSTKLEKLSTAVSKASHRMPIIRPYTTPLEMALSLGADVAKILGYSKPFSVRDPVIKSHSAMSLTDQPNTIPKMSVSAGNSIGLGAELNLPPECLDMDLVSLAQRFSYLNTTTWAVSSAADTTLIQSGVLPNFYIANGSEYHYPAIAYLSMPFSYWNGSIKFKFQAIASAMHRGRLRITWDPYPTADINTPGFYSTPITIILDLEREHEVVLDVPYHSIYNALRMNTTGTSFPLSPGANIQICNGYFTVSVLNVLNTPNNTIDTPVYLNVWIAAGDDYCVYRPGDGAKNISYFASSGSVGRATSVDQSKISMGECITSIRALTKREQPCYMYSAAYDTNVQAYCYRLYELDRPVFRGTKTKARNVTSGTGIQFDYGINNFLTHYEACFAARRGGYINRYTSTYGDNNHMVLTLRDYNFWEGTPTSFPNLYFDELTVGNVAKIAPWAAAEFDASFSGFAGVEQESLTQTVAARKPFYTQYPLLANRTNLTNFNTTYGSASGTGHCLVVFGGNTADLFLQRHIAADEDYQLLFYCGPPIVYIVNSPAYSA